MNNDDIIVLSDEDVPTITPIVLISSDDDDIPIVTGRSARRSNNTNRNRLPPNAELLRSHRQRQQRTTTSTNRPASLRDRLQDQRRRRRNSFNWMNMFGDFVMAILPSYNNSNTGGDSYEELLRLGERIGPARPHGLTTTALSSLPTIPFKCRGPDAPEEESSCVICLNLFSEDDPLVKLDCSHYFHRQCGERWLQERASCPVCRAPVNIRQRRSNRARDNTVHEIL